MKSIGRRPLLGALALGLAASLVGCGSGSNNNGTAQVRVVNASPGYSSLDFYLDNATTASISGVALGAGSDYISVSSGAHSSTLDPAGSTTVAQSQSRSFAGDTSYTILSAGWQGSLYTFQLSETEAAPDSGQAKVRVINAAPDAGSVDVYVTTTGATLADTTPDNGSTPVVANSLTAYVEHPAVSGGTTYRIRVTPTGDKTDADVLLDIPTVTLKDQQITTIVLIPSTGGVLVNALQMDQKGTVTALNNPNARVRVVNALSSGSTDASVGNTVLATVPAHRVAGYTTIAAGSAVPVSLTANSVALAVPAQTFSAGADYTVLVYGNTAAPTFKVLSDDNRLPTTSGKAKVRLVNGLNGTDTGGLDLIENSRVLESSITLGNASSYATIDNSNGSNAEFDIDSASQTLFTKNQVVPANGVYTVWMMGELATPIGTLLADR